MRRQIILASNIGRMTLLPVQVESF